MPLNDIIYRSVQKPFLEWPPPFDRHPLLLPRDIIFFKEDPDDAEEVVEIQQTAISPADIKDMQVVQLNWQSDPFKIRPPIITPSDQSLPEYIVALDFRGLVNPPEFPLYRLLPTDDTRLTSPEIEGRDYWGWSHITLEPLPLLYLSLARLVPPPFGVIDMIWITIRDALKLLRGIPKEDLTAEIIYAETLSASGESNRDYPNESLYSLTVRKEFRIRRDERLQAHDNIFEEKTLEMPLTILSVYPDPARPKTYDIIECERVEGIAFPTPATYTGPSPDLPPLNFTSGIIENLTNIKVDVLTRDEFLQGNFTSPLSITGYTATTAASTIVIQYYLILQLNTGSLAQISFITRRNVGGTISYLTPYITTPRQPTTTISDTAHLPNPQLMTIFDQPNTTAALSYDIRAKETTGDMIARKGSCMIVGEIQ